MKIQTLVEENGVVKVFKETVLLDIRIKQNLTMKNFK